MRSNENEILSPGTGPGSGSGSGSCLEPVPIPVPILNAYYLGGDVSKGYCDFVILNQFKEVVEDNFQLDDTFEGHQTLRKVLEEFLHKHPYSVLYAGFESSGGYENNWYNLLWQWNPLFLSFLYLYLRRKLFVEPTSFSKIFLSSPAS